MSEPVPARSGTTSYGRACHNCAKAKCKCILGSNSRGPCERCLRLRKDCQPAPTIRKRPGRKPASKTAQLQDKLDDLVTLLRTAAATNGTSADALLQQARSLSQVASASRTDEANSPSVTGDPCLLSGNLSPMATSTSSSSHPRQADHRQPVEYMPSPISVAALSHVTSDNNYGVSALEAQECLDIFRSQKLKYLHFVYVPESVTVDQLRQEKPLLWLSIMASCVKSVSRQQVLGEKLRALISQKAVVEHQRSLDIVQGLIGFLGWATYHLRLIGKPFITMYTHLLVAVIQDLYIDKPPPKTSDSPHPMACMRMHGFFARAVPTTVRTVEECRAVLASWLVSAVVGIFLRRTFGMWWNSHMDHCLRMLEENPESPLDGILTQQVRRQRISEEAPHHLLSATAMEISSQMMSVFDFQIKALLSRLEEIKHHAPKDIPENLSFIGRLHELATEIELHEIALYTGTPPPPTPTNPKSPLPDGPNISRITSLTRILHLTKEWFSLVTEQSPSQFLMFAFPMASQISYLTIVMYRLSTLDDPYWDKRLVHRTLDVFGILDKLSAKFSAVPTECGIVAEGPELDTWGACARAIRHLKTVWEPVFLRALGGQVGGGEDVGRGNADGGIGIGEGLGGGGNFPMGQGQVVQLGSGDAMDATGAGMPYDVSWEAYAFDAGEMANSWIADMFAASWDP